MKKVKIEELDIEKFLPFGFYVNLINPDTEKLGASPIEFFRDMVQQKLGCGSVVSFSICRVEKRDMVIDVTEYHTYTEEGILPLDNDILIHVGPATAPDSDIPSRRIRVFRIPKGTIVVIRSGVWHHAPFTVDKNPANVLIVLPERVYANDCRVFKLENKIKIEI